MPTGKDSKTIVRGLPIAIIVFVISLLCVHFSSRTVESGTRALPIPLQNIRRVATPTNREVISEGEDLLYEVSWTVFKIGTVRLKTLQTKPENGTSYYTAAAFINSYQGLPFVNLHAITYTEMDSTFTSHSCRSFEQKDDDWWGLSYTYDSTRQRCFVQETWQHDFKSPPFKQKMRDTLRISGNYLQDGLSLLYFARSRAHRYDTVSVPIIAYGKAGSTYFRFGRNPDELRIDAFNHPIRVMELDGMLNIEGLFGLTGDFKGWFSDDSAAVPIKAEMKVILGSVNVELIEWHRKGWKPPE